MRLARRVARISVSSTIAVMQEARRLKAQGVDVIDLGPGEPDFPTPQLVKEAALKAIDDNKTTYTPVAGIPELRDAVAQRMNRDFGADFSAENVIITAGAKSALYNLVNVCFGPGDRVVIPAPYWVTFPEIVRLAEAEPVFLPTLEENGFELTVQDIQSSLGPTVSGMIVNTPNNPSGAVIPSPTMEAMAEMSRSRDMLLISDETYDRFTYEGRVHASLASFVDRRDENFAIAGSFSKTFAMTGWRIGYLVATKDCIAKVTAFQSHQSGNPCSIAQWAALEATRMPTGVVDDMLKEYAGRRSYVLSRMNGMPGVRCPVPFGAFYAFPNVARCMDEMKSADSIEFSRLLLNQARVATVPGVDFGMEGYIRLSYATSMENLTRAMDRIEEAVNIPAV